MIVGGSLTIFSIFIHQATYKDTKIEILEAERKYGKNYAEYCCKLKLNKSYVPVIPPVITKIIDGADNAARDYLESTKLNKK